MTENKNPAEREFRSFMDFGTREARPPQASLTSFYKHSYALAGPVPIKVRKTFMALDHDMTGGSDHLFVIEGLVCQAAAEVWAAAVILKAEVAPLTMFHHARALYEAHAMIYWVLADLHGRGPQLVKDYLRERRQFERDAEKSIGKVVSDIKPAGHTLIDDPNVPSPPSVRDQVKGHPVLEFDYAVFWKYASAHSHPGNIGTGEIDQDSERREILQIMSGTIRHAAGVYRHIVNHCNLDLGPVGEQLAEAEDYARFRFAGAPVEPGANVTK
jgi:hypothetical protein